MGRRKVSRRDIWRVGGSAVYVIMGNDMLLTKPSGDRSECVRSSRERMCTRGVAPMDILLWFNSRTFEKTMKNLLGISRR